MEILFYVTTLMHSGLEGQHWPLFCVSFPNFIPNGSSENKIYSTMNVVCGEN